MITADTSVLVPALLARHPRHAAARGALRQASRRFPAQVLAEAYSVLTRLPAPYRIQPADASAALLRAVEGVFPLDADSLVETLGRFAEVGIAGGAVYDGLVAVTAQQHGCELLTMDTRARPTYDALAVRYRVL